MPYFMKYIFYLFSLLFLGCSVDGTNFNSTNQGATVLLNNNSNLSVTKSWNQEPLGYTFPVAVSVPASIAPEDGFPVCILLHGNGDQGAGILSQFQNVFSCHILLAPSGYASSWNISDENSDAPDVEMLGELILKLEDYTNVDTSKIRILGISNGAAMANRFFIENKNPSIDKIVAALSQLSEAQYHNDGFYYPSGNTGGPDPYDGYNSSTIPIIGRHYLSIGNTNDPAIPYLGGPAVGVNFLDSQFATYVVAQSQGYVGEQLDIGGTPYGSPAMQEYSYLMGQVVHLQGNSGHNLNQTAINYILDFMEGDCN